MKARLAYFGIKYFPSRGGVSRTTENLIRELKDEFDITIYCYKHPDAKNNIEGVNVVQFPEFPGGAVGVHIYLWLCCLHMLLFGKYDIVHSRKIDAAFFLPLLSLKFRKILASSHESPYVRDKWGPLTKQYFKLSEWIFMHSKATLACISKPLCDSYEARYGRHVRYIPNGTDMNFKYKDEEAKEILKKYNTQDEYLFFAARRVMSTKGCHTMIDALKEIDFKKSVIVAGDMKQLPAYSSKIMKQAQGLDAKFIGYISNKGILLSLVKQSKFFIFPSETEGMSIMLLEVVGSGTPVICSNIPENTAILNPDEVLFFEDKNAHDLAEKLNWAYANYDKMLERAKTGQKRVRKEYSGETMTQNHRNIYHEILQSTAANPVKVAGKS